MKRQTNEHGIFYTGATPDTLFRIEDFAEVQATEGNQQFALHTDIGSLTVLDRMTGFGWRDVETGFRDKDGKFWLASGHCDVRQSRSKTLGKAIEWVKECANTCVAA